MAQTFDTSRVGGGTYELEQDASGNYKLKSVGFAQVNKLNLPDLATSDSPVKKILPVEDEKKTDVADPFKKLSAQNTGGGDNKDLQISQNYERINPKDISVKQASVSELGQKTNTTYNAMTDAEKNAIATGTATVDRQVETGAPGDNQFETVTEPMTFTGATGTETYRTPRTIADQNKFLGRTFTDKATGLQTARSKATDAIGNVIDSVKNNKAIQVASNVLGFVANPIMGGIKMVASMLPEETAVQKVNKGYFNINEGGQRIAGNPATDLYAGMNRTSDFGNLERAGNKRLETRQKTIERKGYKAGDKFFDDTEKMKDDARSYKQAKETATDTSPGATGGEGGGDGGSDSGRVICTDLHRTKELSTRDWIRDTKFTFKTLSIKHVKGYLLWAEPTVRHIQKYPRYRKIWKHIAQHRANDIAWRLNEGKFDLLGRIYAGIGEPVCWALGNFVSDKQISKYNLTHWRRA